MCKVSQTAQKFLNEIKELPFNAQLEICSEMAHRISDSKEARREEIKKQLSELDAPYISETKIDGRTLATKVNPKCLTIAE